MGAKIYPALSIPYGSPVLTWGLGPYAFVGSTVPYGP